MSSYGEVIHAIQQSLYDGKCPDEEGFYCFPRKELCEIAGISPSTFDRCKDEVVDYFRRRCDLATWAKYNEYKGEVLYVDVSYERGVLKFRRNPLTLKPELEYLWALPPLDFFFAYDYFDEKHRRRGGYGNRMLFEAIPHLVNADELEEEMMQARKRNKEHTESMMKMRRQNRG